MGTIISLVVILALIGLATLRLWERRRYASLRRLADVLLARSTFRTRQGNKDGLLSFRLRQAARRGAQESLANRIRKEQGNAQAREMQAMQARDLQELYKQRKARKRLR
jgi:hypothetical protein